MKFLIRDGLESDIEACLALDHLYETAHVWQMTIAEEPGQWQVNFKTEHLPRVMEVTYLADKRRLHRALPAEHGFVVAVSNDQSAMLGYLALRSDPINQIAHVHDLVVSGPYRRQKIGTRLFNVARQWAHEHHLTRIMLETQTKNYPAIRFCEQAGLVFCGFNDHYFSNRDIAIYFSQSLR